MTGVGADIDRSIRFILFDERHKATFGSHLEDHFQIANLRVR